MSKRRTLGIVAAGALAVGVMGWAGGVFAPSVTQAAAATLTNPTGNMMGNMAGTMAGNPGQSMPHMQMIRLGMERFGMGQGREMGRWGECEGRAFGLRGELGLEANLAEALGITEEELDAARTAAHEAALELAVAEGRLTEEQATQLGERGIGRMGGLGVLGLGADDEHLAAALDISVEELNAAREEARAARLAQAVEEGDLTQEQVDRLLAHQAFVAYQRAERLAQMEADVAAAVEAGALTPEQADVILDDLTTFGGERGGWGFMLPGFGERGFGARGHMGGHMGSHMGGRGHMDGFGPGSMMPGMRGEGRGWGLPDALPESTPEAPEEPEEPEATEEESEETESQSTTPDLIPLVDSQM